MILIWTHLALSTILVLRYIQILHQLKLQKNITKALENQAETAWKKYELKANEVENLKKRINQTYNKPII